MMPGPFLWCWSLIIKSHRGVALIVMDFRSESLKFKFYKAPLVFSEKVSEI